MQCIDNLPVEASMRSFKRWCGVLLVTWLSAIFSAEIFSAETPSVEASSARPAGERPDLGRQEIGTVRRLAESMVNATMSGDYARVVDNTYEPVVKELGGRDAAIKVASDAMQQLKDEHFEIKSYFVGTPEGLHSEHGVTFTIVPTRMEMQAPDAHIVARGYLLALSEDAGKTWKFVDGSGLADDAFRDHVLPKLPADLTLPELQKPEITWLKK